MSKMLLGIMIVLVSAGCDQAPRPAERTPETTPWFFPEQQIELLTKSDFMVRALAAHNLGRMGARAEVAIPDLEKLLKDEHPKVREMAAEALERIRAEVGDDGPS